MVDFAAHTANIINRLGQPVSITPAGQPARVVNAVFVQDQAVAFGLVDGVSPTVRITTADAVGLTDGDPVTIGSTGYTVARLREDSVDGDVLIELDKA